MTERDWDTSTEPDRMLAPEYGPLFSQRKVWLTGIACLRQVVGEPFDDWRSAIDAGEVLLDAPDAKPKYWKYHRNWSPPRDRRLTQYAVHCLLYAGLLRTPDLGTRPMMSVVKETMWTVAEATTFAKTGLEKFTTRPETEKQRTANEAWCGVRAYHANVVRDVLGNPFRPVSFAPVWLTPTVDALARQMYESGDFSPMPILADALQDAGCDHPDILAHGRGPGPHVRGCWVVDLVLGKA